MLWMLVDMAQATQRSQFVIWIFPRVSLVPVRWMVNNLCGLHAAFLTDRPFTKYSHTRLLPLWPFQKTSVLIPTHFKLRHSPNSRRLLLRLSAIISQYASTQSVAYHGERLCVDADCALAISSSTVGTASCNGTARLFGSE